MALLKPHVTDGTPCFRGTRDVCVGGECQVSNLFLFNPPIFVYVCHETLQMASEIRLFQYTNFYFSSSRGERVVELIYTETSYQRYEETTPGLIEQHA